MCSFILAFLILIVIFDLVNDSVPEWHITPTSAQTKSDCPANVVSTLQGFHSFDTNCFTETAAHSCSSSFKGQIFDQSHSKHIIMTDELWPWKCVHCQRINKKTALKYAICQAHWSSGAKHSTEPRQRTLMASNCSLQYLGQAQGGN